MSNESTLQQMIRARFHNAGIEIVSLEIRTFPGETIAIVEVTHDYEEALRLAHELDAEIDGGFVTIRKGARPVSAGTPTPLSSVNDERIAALLGLLNSRARTSESQPSLRYVADAAERINLAVAPRHHLVFGRRGVGKTALLLEAKRKLATQDALTLWINMHPLRELTKEGAFLSIAERICDLALGATGSGSSIQGSRGLLGDLRTSIKTELANPVQDPRLTAAIVPRLQQALARLCIATNRPAYIFLDDIHYLRASEVPGLLDFMHGITRDNPVWLKIAGIRHQTRWFIPSPPTGLQIGHDASTIDLDVTLEQPARAKEFLENILLGYVEECQCAPLRAFLGSAAIDRLVLASGGVPRDFLSLCASAMQIARLRPSARTVGVQDVNNAAGAAAKTKLQELEDDAAAAREGSQAFVEALNVVRDFLLNERQITFLRVDFLDKEQHPDEYALMQGLMDLRMLHLLNSSLSDPHHAGRRSEVYLLDLSQYSGTRLKQKLQVLDFVRDHLVLKRTRSHEQARIGDSPRRLVDLLRRGPMFDLESLRENTYRERSAAAP